MNYSRAFRYIFDDKDWLAKVGIGLAIMIVPILNFAWLGYQIQIIRNVRKNEAMILPTWDDLGKRFMDGLMVALAGFIYSLPGLLVACLPMTLMAIPLLAGENQDAFNTLMTGSMVLYFCLLCLFLIYALALSVISPLIQIFYAREGTFASCFKLREMFQVLAKNAGAFFTIWILVLGVSLGASVAISIVTLIIGWFPVLGQLIMFVAGFAGSAYAIYVASHLYGQFSALVFGETAMERSGELPIEQNVQ